MFFVSILLLLLALLTYYYWYFSSRAKYWEKRGVKGPKSQPFFGNTPEFFKVPSNVLEERRYRQYGRIYGYMEFTRPVLTVGEPELLKQIAIKDFHHFPNRTGALAADPVLAKTIINLRDDDWKRVRSIVSSTFTIAKMKRMLPSVNECAGNALNYFDTIANTGKELQLKNTFLSYTLDTIARCAFALRTNSFANENEFYLNARQHGEPPPLRTLTSIFLPYKLQRMFDLQATPQKVLDYFKSLVVKVLNESDKTNSTDFVKLLKNAELNKDENFNYESEEAGIKAKELKSIHKKLDVTEIMAQAILFLGAGYHTTSTLLSFSVYTLAINEEIQEKLYREIRDYFDKHGEIDYDSLFELQYLDAFVNEALRRYPSFTNLDRVASSDYVLDGTGITIEKGTVINLPFYAIHHDPEFFPEPHSFKPERFLPENRHEIKPYTYIPFGLGPRLCVGAKFASLSTKVMLAKFVNRFKAVKTPNTVSEPIYNGVKLELSCEPLLVTFDRRI